MTPMSQVSMPKGVKAMPMSGTKMPDETPISMPKMPKERAS